MLSRTRAFLVATIMVTLVFLSGAFALEAALPGRAYADIGSISAGEDITYDKDGGVLSSMGFDIS